MRNTIQEHWKKEEMIGINCIMFPDDKVIILKYSYFIQDKLSQGHTIHPLCDTTASSILNYSSDSWVKITPFVNPLTLKDQSRILFGEGAMGNEGFIVKLNHQSELEWGIFMTFSNPVSEVILSEENIIAYTDHFEFSFPINAPEKIKIIKKL